MSFFTSPKKVFTAALILRLTLLIYGLAQDAYSPIKYTDIDYYVFTSAASYTSQDLSPYARETYRYTPLLAWLLLPTTIWFSFGKVLFATADLVVGWLIVLILQHEHRMGFERSLQFASLWLLNPMVATISTRGSSEGLLVVMVVGMLWAVVRGRTGLAGLLLGLAVHFKIYPFVYGVSVLWWLDAGKLGSMESVNRRRNDKVGLMGRIRTFWNDARIIFVLASLLSFVTLNALMYKIYGYEFLQHTYLYHITRIDHRHNFSPYNILLYLSSSRSALPSEPITSLHSSQSISFLTQILNLKLESLAFIPQILLSACFIPLILAKKDLPSTMLAQTFAFVTFNKVCTSQYFTWYLCLLPLHLPHSTLLSQPFLGLSAAALWMGTQAWWLQQGYQLEFLGKSTFAPGLWQSSAAFFAVNCWILGMFVRDIG